MTPSPAAKTVAVIGGGISGLTAAWELTGGEHGPRHGSPRVMVFEADDRLGGKIRTGEIGGRAVDLGPDGFLGRRPEATALCRAVGLATSLVPIGASGAAVWARGRRRTLPKGLALGVPTRFLSTARSGILGPVGVARLAIDVLLPRRDVRGPLGDRAIGPLVAHRLGRRVVDELVDPLVGGIHAGSVSDMSTAAVDPLLLAVSHRRTGLMKAMREALTFRARAEAEAAGATTGATEQVAPAFWTLEGGMGTLIERLAERLAERGVEIHTSTPVRSIGHPDGRPSRWILETPGPSFTVDGLILAASARTTADLLEPHAPQTATLLRGIDHASVAIVTLAYPEPAIPTDWVGTGLLVPRTALLPAPVHVRTPDEESADLGTTFLTTACSYLSTKWPHLAGNAQVLLRASVGRFGDRRATTLDDPALIARVTAELGILLGVGGEPTTACVTRWPDAFPQYRVHHLLRVTGIESGVEALPAVAVAGCDYRGVGIPACVASGAKSAHAILHALRFRPGRLEESSNGHLPAV